MNTEYCAHCGHIEPLNKPDEKGTPLIYVHLDDCLCCVSPIAHKMFIALGNSMGHMRANGSLMSRSERSIVSAMLPFSVTCLNKDSHCFEWLEADMRLKEIK